MKEYETRRLVLKVLDSTSAEQVLKYFLRNKSFLKKWEPAKGRNYYTLDYQREMLDKEWKEIQDKSMLRLWIFKKEEPDNVIGSVSFTRIIRGPFLSCYLGYRLDNNEINKGYMTEAVKKGIDIIFREYKLHRVEANIMPENKASLRIVEKLGFHYEGLAVKYLKINRRWEDHMHMVLINPII